MSTTFRSSIGIFCAATLTAAGLLLSSGPAAAAELVDESFRNVSTPKGEWTWTSTYGDHDPCLTAATGNNPESLPPCKAGASDKPGQGAFQLTDNTTGQGGVLTLNRAISAKAGLHVAFDMFQYGASTPSGGDGISFFLVDGGQQNVEPGRAGSGLAYDEMPGAIVGVGFDRSGGFSEPNTAGSGPGRQPNHVVLRGAASTQWRYLEAKKAPGYLGYDAAKKRDDARRTVHIDVSTEGLLSTYIDFHDGKGLRRILKNVPLNDLAGQPKLPPTVRLGFAASTGDRTNFHEIRDFSVSALDPELLTTISADGAYAPGGTGRFQVTVSNDPSAGPTTGPVKAGIPIPAGVTVKNTAGDGWRCRTEGGTITCTRAGNGDHALPPGMSYPPITVELVVPATGTDTVTLTANSDTTNNHEPGGGPADPVTVPVELPETEVEI